MSEAIHVVYDCVIFLQAAARPDRVHGTMQLVRDGRVILCMSSAVIAELRDVLSRPELRVKFPALKPEYVDSFLNELLSRAKMVGDVPAVFKLPRDKKDEPYVDLAIAADARYLVTWNDRHLTYLMRRDTPEGIEFCHRYPNLKIVDPPQLLADMRQAAPTAPGSTKPT